MLLKDFSELCALYLILPPPPPMEGQTSTPPYSVVDTFDVCIQLLQINFRLFCQKKKYSDRPCAKGCSPKERKGGRERGCVYKMKYATQVYSIRNQGCLISLSLSKKKTRSKTFYLCDGSLSGEIFITATTFPLSSQSTSLMPGGRPYCACAEITYIAKMTSVQL